MLKRIAPSWTNALASFWGLAEATVFFIVPDVRSIHVVFWTVFYACFLP